MELERRSEVGIGETFGRHIDELRPSFMHCGFGGVAFGGGDGAVEDGRLDAEPAEVVGLVFHQGDQRADHNGHSW